MSPVHQTQLLALKRLLVLRPGLWSTFLKSGPFKPVFCRYVSLGQLFNPPSFIDDNLELIYVNGDPCPHALGTNYSLTIYFECSRNSVMSRPLLKSRPDDCDVRMLWKHPFACPTDPYLTSDRCKATDPQTGKLNMTSSQFWWNIWCFRRGLQLATTSVGVLLWSWSVESKNLSN